jgi:Tfp pilus assembly protein PilX
MMAPMRLNEKGSVLNVALLILILLSLVAIGVNRLVTLDNKIGSNVKRSWAKFYEAEGVLREAAQWLEDKDKEVLEAKSEPGLYNEAHLMEAGQNYDTLPAGGDGEINEDEMVNALESAIRADTGEANYSVGWPDSAWPDPEGHKRSFITIDYGITMGSSIVMGEPSHLHQFIIAGRAQDDRSDVVIKAGYLKRY